MKYHHNQAWLFTCVDWVKTSESSLKKTVINCKVRLTKSQDGSINVLIINCCAIKQFFREV